MCGLAGYWAINSANGEELTVRVRRMADTLHHRGPDDSGTWVDERSGIAMGFRRLAILDLSADGHQPMVSASGRYVITFNGEVYNFRELRQSLVSRGATFRGHSDTEVMLAAIEHWGVAAAVRKFNGMFALAVWDVTEDTLHLARDPLGIKPLFIGHQGGGLFWGSELKALRSFPGFNSEIDLDALTLYLRHGYVPGPFSIYKGVRKVQPGCIMTFRSSVAEGMVDGYWSVQTVATDGIAKPFTGTDGDAMDAVESALLQSVRQQMVSDVPLGAFLSGGIDSSLIVALMQSQSSKPVQTFSIGYAEDAVNEAEHASAVAKHLGTEHTEWMVTPRDALDQIPLLADIYDEPFADPAMIPTCLVSQLARRKVTVSLSGDGGDESFGGYYYHLSAQKGELARALSLPPMARQIVGKGIAAVAGALEQCSTRSSTRLAASLQYRGRYYHYVDPVSWYRKYVEDQLGRGELLAAARRNPDYAFTRSQPGGFGVAETFMLLDTMVLLPDGFLAKVDRATMAVSLEGRVPFLDTEVVSLAWRLPIGMKIRNGQGKWVLRRILSRYVPDSIYERPKQGFGVPINSWLKGPLHDWAESLLNPAKLREQGLLSVDMVERCWREHQLGICEHTSFLWRVLMFQAWRAHWFKIE